MGSECDKNNCDAVKTKEGSSPEREVIPSLSLWGIAALMWLIISNLSSIKDTQYAQTQTLPPGNYIPAKHLFCNVRRETPSNTDSKHHAYNGKKIYKKA